MSDSEDEKAPEAEAQQSAPSVWSSSKKSGELGGYSSEASSEHGQPAHNDSALWKCKTHAL